MSELDIDAMPRMKDYLTADDLNTDACVNLAATVLGEQQDALTSAARKAAAHPTRENLRHLEELRNFYESDWYKVLSCGLADGEEIAKRIIKRALRGIKVTE